MTWLRLQSPYSNVRRLALQAGNCFRGVRSARSCGTGREPPGPETAALVECSGCCSPVCRGGSRTHNRVYGYVHNQVPSAAARLDQFLCASGIGPNQRVTILSDGARKFEKAASGCNQPMYRILDWFHIAMKFRAAERSVFGCKFIDPQERDELGRSVRGAKWLV